MELSYYGYFTPFGGYGIANIEWVKHLRRQGFDISVNARFKPTVGSHEWDVMNEEERSMFDAQFEKKRIGIIETTPDNFQEIETEIKICNTMAETDEIGPGWVNQINRLDYCIVPNKFYKKVFNRSGVNIPIAVIPHGVDVDFYKPAFRPFDGVFRFGSCGYLNERKGVYELVRAFCSEFDKDEPVELHLHTTNQDFYYYKNFKDERIKITHELWDKKKLRDFYNNLDCFVFPSRAEGVGYPPREAMATGCPTIVMNWSGLEDIALEQISYPLTPDGFEKVNPVFDQPGNWAKVNIKELMYWMRHVYSNREEALERGKNGSKFIKRFFTWENCAYQLGEFLNAVSKV